MADQGVGLAGEPNEAGENCVPLGNAIIIQESRRNDASEDPLFDLQILLTETIAVNPSRMNSPGMFSCLFVVS